MIVLPDAEDGTIVSSFVCTKRDGQTDRQTDLPWLLQRSALRAIRMRCKKTKMARIYSLIPRRFLRVYFRRSCIGQQRRVSSTANEKMTARRCDIRSHLQRNRASLLLVTAT